MQTRGVVSLTFLLHSPFLRSLTVSQHDHRFTADNNADPGLLSDELHDLLHDFTQMEEMLCSLASPCFLMWVSKGGQYKARGNVITFSQDVTNLCTTLPRLPEDLDILVVRKPLSTDPGTVAFKDFRVRKGKVYRLLRFLKEHNRFYKDVEIRPPDSVDLPVDASVIDRLPAVEPREDCSEQETSHSPRDDPIDDSLLPDYSELAHEQNSFVPSVGPLPSEQDAITTGMNDTGLTSDNNTPLCWPPTGLPLSEYSTPGLFTIAFPTLFPTAAADFSLRRDHKIHLHEWVKHLMWYRDSRFATHPRFRFFVLNIIFRHRSMQRGKYLFSRNISHHNMTIGQLKNALSQHNGPRLASDIVRCLKTVKATRPYWNMEGGKLRDMIAQIGTPTFFYTLSMADMSWPDLHKLMPDDPFAPDLTPQQSSQTRFHNVATNPHIVATYLSTKHQLLLDTVLQHLDVEDTARFSDFWYRFEWQARGSGKMLFLIGLSPSHHVPQDTFTAFSGWKTRLLLMTWTGTMLAIAIDSANIFPASSLLTTHTLTSHGHQMTASSSTCLTLRLVLIGIYKVTMPTSATAVRNMAVDLVAAITVFPLNATNVDPVASTFLSHLPHRLLPS